MFSPPTPSLRSRIVRVRYGFDNMAHRNNEVTGLASIRFIRERRAPCSAQRSVTPPLFRMAGKGHGQSLISCLGSLSVGSP